MTARRSFKLATNAAADRGFPPIELEFEDPDSGEPIVLTANYPGDGTLMLAVSDITDEDSGVNSMSSILSILRGALSDSDYRTLRGWIRSGALDVPTLGDILSDLMEAWTSFPTKPSSGSLQSQPTTGTKSTGRVRGAGSTLPPSPQDAS